MFVTKLIVFSKNIGTVGSDISNNNKTMKKLIFLNFDRIFGYLSSDAKKVFI